MKKIVSIAFVSFVLVVLIAVAGAEVINFEVKPENPVKGEVVTIYGQAQPDEEITIKVSFEKVVPVEDEKYVFFIPKINIPEVENGFTVRAEGCENLKVSIKDYAERYPHWVTLSLEASGGVAKLSHADIPAVTYDVLIHGKSLEAYVRLIITAVGYEKADDAGNFSYSYETSSVPVGKFAVQAGNKTETVHLRLPPLPTTPTRIPKNKENQSSGITELLQLLLILIAFVVPLIILAWKKRE